MEWQTWLTKGTEFDMIWMWKTHFGNRKNNNKHVVRFEQTPNGLYAYKPTNNYLKQVADKKKMIPPNDKDGLNNLVTTVKENHMDYSERQFEDAKRAWKLYHIVGAPSLANFKLIIKQNLIKNCLVTVEYVNIVEKILDQILVPKRQVNKKKSTLCKE